ncbi:hypothetical protein [Hasllibacter halocynthiae]|nr:hypothetical protein [Hasllibacter halocynthiae]
MTHGITRIEPPPEAAVTAIQQAPGLAALMTPQGQVVFLNSRARRELAGGGIRADWWDLWLTRERPRLASAVRDAAAGRTVRLPARRAAGPEGDWDVSVRPAHADAEGRVRFISANARPPMGA